MTNYLINIAIVFIINSYSAVLYIKKKNPYYAT